MVMSFVLCSLLPHRKKKSVSTCYREEYLASKSVHQENGRSSLQGIQTHSTVSNDLSSTKIYKPNMLALLIHGFNFVLQTA